MAYIKIIPSSEPEPIIIRTKSPIPKQALLQLEGLLYSDGITKTQSVPPLIRQGAAYYRDAESLGWRTAALLYYYSYLNLAKAYLAKNKVFSSEHINSKPLYHGLKAKQDQQTTQLLDYTIEIHPPESQRKTKNIFSTFYEELQQTKWPFTKTKAVKIRDIIPYCVDLGMELITLYNEPSKIFSTSGLQRKENGKVWYEFLVPQSYHADVEEALKDWNPKTLTFDDLTDSDFQDWFLAYNISKADIRDTYIILRGPKHDLSVQVEHYEQTKQTIKPFCSYSPDPSGNERAESWQFVQPLKSLDNIPWHPLLSSYLISYALGEILRYQPYLLESTKESEYLAAAWCQQSTITDIQHWLMLLSDPPVTLRAYW